ncbi:hypothetical protein BX600DRAFT_511506 [Xylariales sp. PMI_506]|nr:hypothetical protein BX600DRAFT_511506 [Xylariales sp. PMI_506]
MPASLRPMLYAASISPTVPWRVLPSSYASRRLYASYRPMKRPITVGAFTVPHSAVLPISSIPVQELLESPAAPDKSLADELTELFTKNPATFYHGTQDFYTLKKNTRLPEVCILGRSNVGKSTFVNALADRRGNELARTSARAGKTRTMNAFGFGPAPLMKDLADTDVKTKRTEDLPRHTFYILDMPGYGHKSLKEWGRHINLYLNKRQAIKGAILLVDGEVGPKQGDLDALELLRSAGLRTAVVLTKADKAKDEEMLRETCDKIRGLLRETGARDRNGSWSWDTDVFVTALSATNRDVGADSVAVARLAVARMVGLIKEKVRPEPEIAKSWSNKVVSFDDIQYAPSKPQSAATSGLAMAKPSSGFTALEKAAMEQHKLRMAGRVSGNSNFGPVTSKPHSWSQTRSYSTRIDEKLVTPEEFQKALKDFLATLQAIKKPLDEFRRIERESQRLPDVQGYSLGDPTRETPRERWGTSPEEKQAIDEAVRTYKALDETIYRYRLQLEDLRKEMRAERIMRSQEAEAAMRLHEAQESGGLEGKEPSEQNDGEKWEEEQEHDDDEDAGRQRVIRRSS